MKTITTTEHFSPSGKLAPAGLAARSVVTVETFDDDDSEEIAFLQRELKRQRERNHAIAKLLEKRDAEIAELEARPHHAAHDYLDGLNNDYTVGEK